MCPDQYHGRAKTGETADGSGVVPGRRGWDVVASEEATFRVETPWTYISAIANLKARSLCTLRSSTVG